MFEKILVEQNPFWENQIKFNVVKRDIFSKVEQFLDSKYILTLVGIRRSGKSYLLKQLIDYLIHEKKINPKNILNLNLENVYFNKYKDDVEYLEKIYEDYLQLNQIEGKHYLILDEVQFFKNWQVFVKSKYEQENIKFIITGSNSWMLSSEFSTLLSGRNIEIKIFPFNFNEFLTYKKIDINSKIKIIENRLKIKKVFSDYLKYGSFPEIVLDINQEENFKEILQSYLKNILYQDIIPRFEVKKISELEKLFYYFLSNYGNLYSYNKLSKIFDINDKTIKEYIKYFQDSFLLFEIEKFDYSLKKQVINDKKVYISDLGFINSISFKFSEDRGRLLENLVFIELKRRGHEIYYHKQKKECDFVIKEGLEIVSAIQVTKSLEDIDTKKREIEGLIDAMKTYNLKTGLILTEDEETEFIQDGFKIKVMPIYKWLLDSPKGD